MSQCGLEALVKFNGLVSPTNMEVHRHPQGSLLLPEAIRHARQCRSYWTSQEVFGW